ncbi:hypothetical protein C348_03006 [Cryptococcus neoformans Gb118]|nr:hypothetical protein C348_03006 [Cryptococcus neoformans var. grubii Gb118]
MALALSDNPRLHSLSSFLPLDVLPCIPVATLVVTLRVSFIFSSKSNIVGRSWKRNQA